MARRSRLTRDVTVFRSVILNYYEYPPLNSGRCTRSRRYSYFINISLADSKYKVAICVIRVYY